MKQEILDRIKELGGNIDNVKGTSLQEILQTIEFKQPLYPHELWGTELYGVDEYYEKNKNHYLEDKISFYQNLMTHFFSEQENPYGQMFYIAELFTPFKKNTNDYEEWNEIFTDEDEVDLSEIYEVSKNKKPDFIKLLDSNGYPDSLYISLSDNDPNNPTVFGTDHEEFFSEISNEGTLNEFLRQFYTKEEFLNIVTNYLENKKTDK